jgi:hypothetical protein
VDLERDPLSLMNTIEELLGRKNSGFGLENREYNRTRSVTLTMRHLLSLKVVTDFADKRRSLGIVRLLARATELLDIYLPVVQNTWCSTVNMHVHALHAIP